MDQETLYALGALFFLAIMFLLAHGSHQNNDGQLAGKKHRIFDKLERLLHEKKSDARLERKGKTNQS